MSSTSRLARLEIAANENRRKRKQKPLTDYSSLSDEELKSLYEGELEKMMAEPNPWEGWTDQQMSNLYMKSIQEGNRKNDKKLK